MMTFMSEILSLANIHLSAMQTFISYQPLQGIPECLICSQNHTENIGSICGLVLSPYAFLTTFELGLNSHSERGNETWTLYTKPWARYLSVSCACYSLRDGLFRLMGDSKALITNFHLPHSSLLVLVSAFAGRKLIQQTYKHALKNKYRFFSYGDSMFIIQRTAVAMLRLRF